MKKRTLLIVAAIVASLFVVVSINAGTDVQDVIKMDNKAYKAHKKGIVEFTHKKHAEEYAKKNPDFYKNGCGECHHNEKSEPLKDLKIGDDVKNCMECHKKPAEAPKGKKAPKKLSKKEKREYHANAIHDNCKGCHKAFNKKNKTKAAPTTCAKCHPKTK